MFKRTLTLTALSLATLISSSAAVAADGTINFTGSVTDAPCVIAPASQDQSVALGQVKTSDFTVTGDSSEKKPFYINLERCAITTMTQASVTFNGISSQANSDLLALNSANAASNLAIEISDSQGNLLPMGSPSPVSLLNQDNTTLTFGARYTSTADVVEAGEAAANTTFTLTYS